MKALELTDIQGIVARGYGNLKAARYVMLRIADPGAARAWLAEVANILATGEDRPARTAVNVAATAGGLRRLGLPADALAMFSNELVGGMATPHRQRILGDVDQSAPDRWLWGGPSTTPVDLALLLFAEDATTLEQLQRSVAASGVEVVASLDTAPLDDREQFGFRDGISQPLIEGLPKTGPAWNTVKSGEFVLGYENEYGKLTDRPILSAGADPGGLLPSDPAGSGGRDLGRNGSYLVFRHLRQDVDGFWHEVDRLTRAVEGRSDPDARVRLAATMVGRWPSGAPLTLAPEHDDPALAQQNDFEYGRSDPDGLACPIGAHIRRSNPRDSLEPYPGTDRSFEINKRHRILRRGRKFGVTPVPAEVQSAAMRPPGVQSDVAPVEHGPERGLYFIGLNANIARQFEFIQHTWLNNPKFAGLYDDVDPLMGTRPERGCTFTIQADPVRRRVTGLPQFVHVRGGAYFFLPGIRAIRYLASLR